MFGSLEPAIGFAAVQFPDKTGFTWTLPSLLGHFLAELELAYGPRDRDYTPLGIEFEGNRPKLWYPGNRKHVSIILSDSARTDWKQSVFQLAHEAVHLLSRSGNQSAPMIEEGLAVSYSHAISERHHLELRTVFPPYNAAEGFLNRDHS